MNTNYPKKQPIFFTNRRSFLICSACFAVAHILGCAPQVNLINPKDINLYFNDKSDGYLIANTKNGVVHHSEICKDHLPKHEYRIYEFYKLSDLRPHNINGVNIYEVVAKQLLKKSDFTNSMIYFQKSVDITPERIHLHDHVAKLYGRKNEYSEIKKWYEKWRKNISSKLKTDPQNVKYIRVRKDIESRLAKIELKYGKHTLISAFCTI